MTAKSYKIASSDVVFEDFDGDLVVLNLRTGQYFGFNESASTVWGALHQGVESGEISSAMAAHQQMLEGIISTLVAADLLVESNDPSTPMSADLRAAFSKIAEPPQVNVFDDLADLIVADPIHDTAQDEGWPVRSA